MSEAQNTVTSECAHLPELLMRPSDGHKGTFGTVVVIGGQQHMIGAPAFAARAALRTGCGLVKIMTNPELILPVLTLCPSATGLAWPQPLTTEDLQTQFNQIPENAVLALGCGLGQSEESRKLIDLTLQCPQSIVIDADGINNLCSLIAQNPKLEIPHMVLTPHPGEFKRMQSVMKLDDPIETEDQRRQVAEEMAQRLGCIILLKGYRTVITSGHQTRINQTGNACLATAGSGDVLTGIIASLITQGMTSFEAASLGAYLHGLAGDLWAELHGDRGILANELADMIPQAIQQYATS